MNYHWNWSVLVQQPYYAWLLEGFMTTVALAVVGWAIALPLGTVIGIFRDAPSRTLRIIGTAYVSLFRNIPLLVQIFLWFFVFPEVVPAALGMFLKRDLPYPEFSTAAFGLGCYTASRVAETVRSGLSSAGRGQMNAALASGMTPFQAYRYVLLPVAFRLIVPPLTNEFLGIFKNSSVALTIGVLELTMQAHQIESYTFQGFEAFTAATVIYAVMSWTCLALAGVIASRSKIVGTIGSGG